MKTLLDTLYFTWIIGTKDIVDALKNKSNRTNIILMVFMVFFFYWLNMLRPFDPEVTVVIYDKGDTSPVFETITLGDGSEYDFREADSLEDMKQKMAYQNLGLVLPADFDQILASGTTPTLSGYIFWVDRSQVEELESKYSQAFSEILGQPVQIIIGQNIIIPQTSDSGNQTNLTHLLVYFVFWTGMALIPNLMLEEKQTKTIDALLTSPANSGQIVLGKALAGLFYILIVGGLAMVLFSPYIVHWGLATVAFLGYALFATGLALALGSFINSRKQLAIWSLVLILLLVIPPLFYMETNLKAGIRAVLTWFPSSALASLLRFSCSTGISPAQLLSNLAVALVSILAVYGLVIWKVQRSNREA